MEYICWLIRAIYKVVEVNFIAEDNGKVLILHRTSKDREYDIKIKQQKLEITEPQADVVKEVLKIKYYLNLCL